MTAARQRATRQLPAGPLRGLGAVRLSHLTDETLSPEVQTEKIASTIKARGDIKVDITSDLNVSGAVSPFEREDLGPWLTDPERIAMWDYIIVAKLDRITRSLLDFQLLLQWCEAHGKFIISVSEGFDLSTPIGKMIANILIMFAEFERTRMGERRSERAQADIARGWYGGGWLKYGFDAVKIGEGPGAHYERVENLDEKCNARYMADGIFAGKSAEQIARELAEREIPTKRGGKWAGTTVLDILRDPAGIIDADTWARLQPIISAMSKPKYNRRDAANLSGCVLCGKCGGPMWGQVTTRGDKEWQYYRCHSDECKNTTKMIRAEMLEAAVDETVVSLYGAEMHTERVLVPGGDVQRQLSEIDRSLALLSAKLAARSITRAEYRAAQDILLDEQERLEGLPQEPDRYEVIETGLTVAEFWAKIDWPVKRQYLTSRGWIIRAVAGERRGDVPVVSVEGGELTEDARALGIL